MGSISLPNGESVFFSDGGTPYSAAQISAAEASSLAALMGNRERFDYVWANQAARTLQAGMVQGARGYQIDTKTEYIYDPTWRLALPYAEYTATATNVPNNTLALLGNFSLDSAASTDSTLATTPSSGVLQIVQPGIYSVSSNTALVNGSAVEPVTSRSILDLSVPPGYASVLHRAPIQVGEDLASISMPTLRVTASNYQIQFVIYKNTAASSGVSANTRVRLARIG